MTIVDKMTKADDLARANANLISRLEMKVKNLQSAMTMIKKVENNQELLFKWKNEQALKIIDTQAMITDAEQQLEMKLGLLESNYKESGVSIKRLEALQDVWEQRSADAKMKLA